jgi:hypothetical protein
MFLPRFAWSAWTQPPTVLADTTGEGAALASCSLGRCGHSQPLGWRARQFRALIWPVFDRSAWAQPATVVSITKFEGGPLASVPSVGVGSGKHCGGGHDGRGRCSGLCSLHRRGLRQPLWWWARHVRALLWPLFVRSAWAQPATVVAGTTGKGASLATGRPVGVVTASNCDGGHVK